MGEPELGQHGGHALGFPGIGRQRPAGGHVAELARTRAQAAQDHDGEGLGAPALADIGAGGALADRVQAERVHALAQVEIHRPRRQAGADPRRMVWPRIRGQGLGLAQHA